MSLKTVLITGGIGSGKSVVSRICRCRGFEVYDCDYHAKELMNSSKNISDFLRREIPGSVDEKGKIDKGIISHRIFSDDNLRLKVNGVVHAEVEKDLSVKLAEADSDLFIIEAAITTDKLLEMVSEIWYVDSPKDLRMERVVERSGLTEPEINAIFEVQKYEYDKLTGSFLRVIHNNENHSLVCQVNELLNDN